MATGTVNIGGIDHLEVDFNAGIGARVKGGWRFGGTQSGPTPYAAVQVLSLYTPTYSERATAGNNQFALTYASQTTTDTRSQIGFWADNPQPPRQQRLEPFNPGSRINAAFQTSASNHQAEFQLWHDEPWQPHLVGPSAVEGEAAYELGLAGGLSMHFHQWKRREFITLLGGAAAWPLAARAQQSKVARIGALYIGLADGDSFKKELRESLHQLGTMQGRDSKFSNGHVW